MVSPPNSRCVDAVDCENQALPMIEALQNVFYRLQTSKQAVNCMELTESFGWDAEDPFIQHDVQELNRIFCDRLEEQMENTESAGSIKRLFEGEMENHVECLDVDYTSSRRETFYDIQLSLKSDKGNDLQTLEESLAEFTAEEILDGENLYKAGDYGEQRAKKGIRFVKLPPVLTFQLRRFHFDLQKMEMVKLDSRFEFPRRLDLSKFMPHAGIYLLHSVVVHRGGVDGGHYRTYVRPNLDERCFKFDDAKVTPCSDKAAVEAKFGGSAAFNAYMLVYIQEQSAEKVLRVPNPKQVNSRIVDRCQAQDWSAGKTMP